MVVPGRAYANTLLFSILTFIVYIGEMTRLVRLELARSAGHWAANRYSECEPDFSIVEQRAPRFEFGITALAIASEICAYPSHRRKGTTDDYEV